MRIVLDTNILVRANIKAPGPAREALLKIIYGNHALITSPFLLREVERALAYPRLQEVWRLGFLATCHSPLATDVDAYWTAMSLSREWWRSVGTRASLF